MTVASEMAPSGPRRRSTTERRECVSPLRSEIGLRLTKMMPRLGLAPPKLKPPTHMAPAMSPSRASAASTLPSTRVV